MQPHNMCEDNIDPCWGEPGDRKKRKKACLKKIKKGENCTWNGMRQVCGTRPENNIDECQKATTSKDCKTLFKQEGMEWCRWNKVDERCYDSKWDCTNALDATQCNRFRNKVNPNCEWVSRLMPSASKKGKKYCKDMKWDLTRTTPANQIDPDCAEHDFRRCAKDERCFWNKNTKDCY